MRCPWCTVAIHPRWGVLRPNETRYHGGAEELDNDTIWRWLGRYATCPSCGKYFIYVRFGDGPVNDDDPQELLWPKHAAVKAFSAEVPSDIVAEFNEAHYVLADSPKASAALSRRLLQHILTEKASASQRDLAKQIEAVLPSLPSYLQNSLDGIRNIGNFAAHPLKSQNAAAIFDVEPGEAEWSLDTLEEVIDFYYVRPAVEAGRRADLNRKLAEAGKPPLK